MFNSGLTPSDVLAMSNNDGFGNNGVWWLIILIVLFGGWGWNGNGNNSVANGYTLASDFATLQRQIDSTSNATQNAIYQNADQLQRQVTSIGNGISSLGYDQLSQFNNVNTNVLQSANALQSQMAQCCCDNRAAIKDVQYAIATNSNAIEQSMQSGFCQTNFNNQTNTRDIVDSQNAGTQAILAKLSQMESNAKDERIAELQAQNSDLRLSASQCAQNTYLVNQLRPSPIPAYITTNPYCNCGQTYAGYYGTTIA